MAIAALIGIGLVSTKIALKRGSSFRCCLRASSIRPARMASQSLRTSEGRMFARTLITPLPPTEPKPRVIESSPESIVISHAAAIALAVSSLMATTISISSYIFTIVSGRSSIPVRPGMLYSTMGRPTSPSRATCSYMPRWGGLL